MMKQSPQKAKYVKTNSADSFVVVGELNVGTTSEVGDRRLSTTYEMVNSKHLSSNEDSESTIKPDFSELTKDTLATYFDVDGRVVKESKLRQSLFHGGCSSEIRRTVWCFIFGLYPMLSTTRERKDVDLENHYKYHALKRRWQAYMGDYDDQSLCENLDLSSVELNDFMSTDLPTCEAHSDTPDYSHSALKDMAKTYAWRQTMDAMPFTWYRVIDKDIPRTDLDHVYFKENSTVHFRRMKNILATFGFFHPKVGYVQGMNDILTRFLVVLDSEVDAYWCFSNYMEGIENDFDENGMVEKMVLVQRLLKELEPNLYSHMVDCRVEDLIFCHRWLLVSFKREFDYEESIRYFEMVQSRYLELDSPVAVSAQDDQFRIEVMNDKGKQRSSTARIAETKYTFEVFVCVAIIMLKRQEFLACTEAADVFQIACHIRGTLCLQDVHAKAYNLFFKYCKKSVSEHYKGNGNHLLNALTKLFRWK